ncbi:hypothetical protein C5167_012121 [Papaver somniferum]|uniref:Uncharacterized protein n=1 Tax=Papaver somniferum TaxID=3469 RepID=A0A4Y7IX90_PAPSO|nr:hypothetical protein C5167_012121 [Papaver somniferum]
MISCWMATGPVVRKKDASCNSLSTKRSSCSKPPAELTASLEALKVSIIFKLMILYITGMSYALDVSHHANAELMGTNDYVQGVPLQ